MPNSKNLFGYPRRGVVLVLGGVLVSFLLIAQSAAPHYHSKCCYPLSPHRIKKIPPEIREQLTEDRCLVPQNPNVIDDPQPNNAIHEQWAAKGQDDWAVLCITSEELSIRIFWGGKRRCEDKIVLAHFRPNDGHWKDPETYLWAAPPTTIRAYNDAFGGRKLPILDHSGLEVGGDEASTIYYCQDGKWMHFVGND